MPPLPTLVCKACGFINESERVYCHGCGSKLDREILIAQQQKQAPSPREKQRQVKKLMSPSGGVLSRSWSALCQTLALAAIAGVLVEVVRAPEGALPLQKNESIVETPQIDTLEKLANAPSGRLKTFQEEEINAYLKRENFKKIPSWLTSYIPLRTFVNFDDSACRLNVVASVAGYPIYFGLTGQLHVNKTTPGLVGTCQGGNIGRLPIPVSVAEYAGAMIPFCLSSFQHEQQLLGQLGTIEFAKGRVVLASKGPAAPTTFPSALPKAAPVGH